MYYIRNNVVKSMNKENENKNKQIKQIGVGWTKKNLRLEKLMKSKAFNSRCILHRNTLITHLPS